MTSTYIQLNDANALHDPISPCDSNDYPNSQPKLGSTESKSNQSSTRLLDEYREREYGDATCMDLAQTERLRRTVTGERRPALAEHIADPENAMSELIRHVQLDPDGGIANLHDIHQDIAVSTQHSKIAALMKSPGEIFLAFVGVIRGIANPVMILIAGMRHFHMVAKGQSDDEHATVLYKNLGHGALVTHLMTIVFIIECGTVFALFIKVGRDFVYMMVASRTSGHRAKMSGLAAHPRYMFLAKLCWKDLPVFQSFSGLKALGWVHPDLIGRNSRSFFSLHHQASRLFLERFLQVQKDTASDEDLAEDVAKLLLKYDHGDEAEEEKGKAAREYLQEKPYGLTQLLLNSSLASNDDAMSQANCKASALKMARVIRYIPVAESFAFCIVASVMLAAGCLVFLAKLCIVARALGDVDTPISVLVLLLASFLLQVMGIVSINQLLIRRVETFVFGGADAEITTEEHYLAEVYLANLAETVWASQFIPTYQKIAITLKLDDDDLQQLIIEEDSYSKSAVTLSVKQFMYRSGITRPNAVIWCLDPNHESTISSPRLMQIQD
eukprot:gnl/TRDRNA2_/TRDRNA2_176597_c3_seq1.p1 gnl/TRDRNA2_/TRDRNA2_176597_c3~~gnl/TRDRNA2_/TRDRNA2_176597_c3_seq1.p1  ORF type:complete len:556 (+),score=75.46 gnl/TRDRNA2_/TRDRNA2_176597_c3_seq1:80-1747(+)